MNIKDVLKELSLGLPANLSEYVSEQRWFRSKARRIKRVHLVDIASGEKGTPLYFMALIHVEYDKGGPKVYYLPLAVATLKAVAEIDPSKLISTIKIGNETVKLYEASEDEAFNMMILNSIAASAAVKTREGSFVFEHTDLLPDNCPASIPLGSVKKISAEQSNTSIVFGEAFIMKNYRMVEEGTNPDFDISLFLTTRTGFRNFPSLLGYVEYLKEKGGNTTIAILQEYIGGADDCWEWTCGRLKEIYASIPAPGQPTPAGKEETIRSLSGDYPARMEELGRVTARFHTALASDRHFPAFAPEPVTERDAAKWAGLFSCQIRSVLGLAAEMLPSLPEEVQEELARVIGGEEAFLERVKDLSLLCEEGVSKIRVHGDYHLGQVLKRDGTFFMLDFEGEPARPLAERKVRQCALKDVAGMLRSFDYAAYAVLFELGAEKMGPLEEWGTAWRDLARRSFLDGYLSGTGTASFLPRSHKSLQKVLSVYELDKAIYELNYEMNNRPGWLKIPVRGLLGIMQG
ncbi:MAG: hypothetical protein P9M00_03275 [Candidatus Tritonobacter lacicola]|nr:hypothetical protein [Candidatus Tritonobacter lacicola]